MVNTVILSLGDTDELGLELMEELGISFFFFHTPMQHPIESTEKGRGPSFTGVL